MLSIYCSIVANKDDPKIGSASKLVPNLGKKVNVFFIIKIFNSFYAWNEISFHSVLKFKQLDWLKNYIEVNTDKRKNASNSFEKYFFKLMNNTTFDKTMANLRKLINLRLLNNAGDYKKICKQNNFCFTENV